MHKWLLADPRVQLHFTPTYSSWISQVERWFAELQRRCLDRGVFCSLDDLTIALEDWIKIWTTARPFKWTNTADQIIDRIRPTATHQDRYTSRPYPAGPAPLSMLSLITTRAPLRASAARRKPPRTHAVYCPVIWPASAFGAMQQLFGGPTQGELARGLRYAVPLNG